jgi:hypothetical protein
LSQARIGIGSIRGLLRHDGSVISAQRSNGRRFIGCHL